MTNVAILQDLTKKLDTLEKIVSSEKTLIAKTNERVKKNTDQITVVKAAIQKEMEDMDVTKVQLYNVDLELAAKAPTLVVKDEKIIPEDWFKTERRLDKRGLLKAIKDGEEIDGAMLSNGGINLRLKWREQLGE